MGYHVTLTDSDVVLPKENHQEILSRWHEMNDKRHDSVKSGGSYSGGRTMSKNYSWMPTDYEKTTHTPQQVLEHLGFDFSENTKGDIVIQGYESKTGQEDLFFKEIGNLVTAGGVMKWEGEDDASYAWFFDGKKMQEVNAQTADTLKKELQAHAPAEASKPVKKSRYQL